MQPIVAALTKIETDELVKHNSHRILADMFMFTSVAVLIESSTVFNAQDKKSAIKSLQDQKKAVMVPIMLAASILDPSSVGSSLSNEEMMDGTEFIFNSSKSVGLNEASVMVQLTNYRNKLDLWKREFVWAGCSKVKPTAWWKAFFGHTDLGNISLKKFYQLH